jgi:FlaA1/EpsC-like NDP-sugar epimerase
MDITAIATWRSTTLLLESRDLPSYHSTDQAQNPTTMTESEYHPDRDLALITGATGGIGKATCHKLACMGISIAAHYHAAKDVAEALVEELRTDYSVRADCFQADMGDYEEVRPASPSCSIMA